MLKHESESTFIEITSKTGRHIMGSLYQSPSTTTNHLQRHINDTVSKVKSEKGSKQLIMGMDHNLDLLKSAHSNQTKDFLENFLEKNIVPTITRPTRITNTSATLIDNTFISEELQKNFASTILVEDISDHLPSLTLLRQTKLCDKKPLEFESRNLTDDK